MKVSELVGMRYVPFPPSSEIPCPDCEERPASGVVKHPTNPDVLIQCRECLLKRREFDRREASFRATTAARASSIEGPLSSIGVNVSAFGKARIENFRTDQCGERPVEAVRAAMELFRKGEPGGVYLYGDTGVGKTHLVIGALRALLEMPSVRIDFLRFRRAESIETEVIRSDDRDATIRQYQNFPLLVVDELRPTKLAFEFFPPIMEGRINRNTWFTSNLALGEIAEQEDIDRLADRIRGACQVVEVAGQSQRGLEL